MKSPSVNAKKATAELQEWTAVKRQYRLTDAQVQMARELGMKPRRVLQTQDAPPEELARRIEVLYLRRHNKSQPDVVVPLRQALHEARERERAEAPERRRRKRQSDQDHLEAMRVSILALRRLYGGVGSDENPGQIAD